MKAELCAFSVAFALSCSVLPGSALASYDTGAVAAQKGDYATALREWTPLAVKGDVWAQISLGMLYEKGQGVPQEFKDAVKWYRLAAAHVPSRQNSVVARRATLATSMTSPQIEAAQVLTRELNPPGALLKGLDAYAKNVLVKE